VRVDLESATVDGRRQHTDVRRTHSCRSGNFVTAQPGRRARGYRLLPYRSGARIDGAAIRQQLGGSAYRAAVAARLSPTGEVFNLSAEEVAMHAAIELRADKLILLLDGPGLAQGRKRSGNSAPAMQNNYSLAGAA